MEQPDRVNAFGEHTKHKLPQPWERSKVLDGYVFVPINAACAECAFDHHDRMCRSHDCAGGTWRPINIAALLRLEYE